MTSLISDETHLFNDNSINNDCKLSPENCDGSETLQANKNKGMSNTERLVRDESGTTFPNNPSSERCNEIKGDHDIPPHHMTSQINYSVTQVRIVLSLTAIFGNVVFATDSVIAQYLLDRWSDESGHNKSLNHSGPDKGLCDINESDPWVIHNDEIQARVSMATMYYSFAFIFPAFLSSLIYGALVDIIGRRPPFIATLVGYTSKVIVAMVIIRFDLDPNFFYLSYACDGIGGGLFVNLIASFSITADISEQKGTRILGIAFLTFITKVTNAGTDILIGMLIKHVGYVAASSAILAPVSISLIISIFFLPETLPVAKQKLSLKRLLDYTTRIVFLYSRVGDKRKRLCLFISLIIFFTSVVNTMNLGTNDTLYQKHEPFCWDSAQLAYYTAVGNLASVVAFVYLCMCRCITCVSEEVMSMIGMLFVAGSFTLEAFVNKSWQMFIVPILMIPGLNITPITRGVMSILAGPDKQGVMFSSIALIEIVCCLVSRVVYNKIYAVTVDFMPGFVYLVMAGVSLVTFLLYIPFFHFYDGPPRSYKILRETHDNEGKGTSINSSASTQEREVT